MFHPLEAPFCTFPNSPDLKMEIQISLGLPEVSLFGALVHQVSMLRIHSFGSFESSDEPISRSKGMYKQTLRKEQTT